MRAEPKDLSHARLVEALQDWWGIGHSRLQYLAVGAGSYHWVAEVSPGKLWFVTADDIQRPSDLQAGRADDKVYADLCAAYMTAAVLRNSGFDFVVAPVADGKGEVVHRISNRWAVALFPYIEGRSAGSGEWIDWHLRLRATGLVARLHASRPATPVRIWSSEIRGMIALRQTLERLDEPWKGGPYGERTRSLLATHREVVQALIGLYDRLSQDLAADTSDAWVITHGEPHSSNFIVGGDGQLHLVDWDTVRLAPRERDLFALGLADPHVPVEYTREVGRSSVRAPILELFRARWALSEICEYTDRFRGDHRDGPDERRAWRELVLNIPTEPGWPAMTRSTSDAT